MYLHVRVVHICSQLNNADSIAPMNASLKHAQRVWMFLHLHLHLHLDVLKSTSGGMQVATALGAVLRNEKAKSQLCGVFGSFGWSGEAVDEMEGRLKVSSLPLFISP